MSMGKILTIWTTTEEGCAWMIEAWDEFTALEDNPSGWDDAVKRASDAHREIRIVEIHVPNLYVNVSKLFDPAKLDGEILGVTQS